MSILAPTQLRDPEGSRILWILGPCPWETALWASGQSGGLPTWAVVAHTAAAVPLSGLPAWAPLWMELLSSGHFTARALGQMRPIAGASQHPGQRVPLPTRSSMPPPIPAVSTAERGCVTNPGALCSQMHKPRAPGPCMSVCIRLNLRSDTQHTCVHTHTQVRMCLHALTCTHSPSV